MNGIPSLKATQKKSGGVPIMSANSGSSRDVSEDDDIEGINENELTQNMDPADAKRVRR